MRGGTRSRTIHVLLAAVMGSTAVLGLAACTRVTAQPGISAVYWQEETAGRAYGSPVQLTRIAPGQFETVPARTDGRLLLVPVASIDTDFYCGVTWQDGQTRRSPEVVPGVGTAVPMDLPAGGLVPGAANGTAWCERDPTSLGDPIEEVDLDRFELRVGAPGPTPTPTPTPTATPTPTPTTSASAGFSASPEALGFEAYPGDPHIPQTLTVTNTGTAPLVISSVSVSGTAAGDFAISSDGCTREVAPQDACEVVVDFTPTTSGERSAFLVFATNIGPRTVSLRGQSGSNPI